MGKGHVRSLWNHVQDSLRATGSTRHAARLDGMGRFMDAVVQSRSKEFGFWAQRLKARSQ